MRMYVIRVNIIKKCKFSISNDFMILPARKNKKSVQIDFFEIYVISIKLYVKFFDAIQF